MRSKIIALAIVAGASTAVADSVDLGYTGVHGRQVNIDGGPTVRAGYMKFDVLDGSASGGKYTTGQQIRTFCIDVGTTLDTPDTYDITTLSGVAPAGSITTAESDAVARMLTYAVANNLNFTTGETGRDNAATFQIAIWEVLSDFGTFAGLGTTTGTFKIEATHYQGDATLLTALFGAANNTLMAINPNIIIHGLDSSGGQDQLNFTVIPLPTSAGLAAVGLSGVLLASRRRFV